MEGVGNDEDLVIYGDDGSVIMKGIEPRTSWSIVRSTKHSANLRTLYILNNLSLNKYNKKYFTMLHVSSATVFASDTLEDKQIHNESCQPLLIFFFLCKMPGRGKNSDIFCTFLLKT